MNSATKLLCNNPENLCFELDLNLSNLSYNNIPIRTTHFLRLSQNSSSYWITITILFIFISLNLILNILKKLFYFNLLNKKSIEIIDFTNQDEYRSMSNQEFQLRYGPRSLIHHKKPYHLYRHVMNQSIN